MASGPRIILVSSAERGVGVTTVCSSLAVAFRGVGLQTRAFAISSGLGETSGSLQSAVGRVLPLDPGLLGSMDKLRAYVHKNAQGCDVVLVDGLPLHDSLPMLPPSCTTACIASHLNATTLLVVDGRQTLDSLVSGARACQQCSASLRIPCLLVNYADSGSTAPAVQAALEAAWVAMRVVGCVSTLQGVPGDTLPAVMRRHIDIDGLLHACPPCPPPAQQQRRFLSALAASITPGGSSTAQQQQLEVQQGVPVQAIIAVATDDAFSPPYGGDLAALEASGATIVPFSPLYDAQLPTNCQGVYLGGAMSDTPVSSGRQQQRRDWAALMQQLASNSSMQVAVRAFCEAGGVLLAQSTGLAYLSSGCSLQGGQSEHMPMVGVFPFRSSLHPAEHPASQGYVELTVTAAARHLLGPSTAGGSSGSPSGHQQAQTGASIHALLHSRVSLLEERTHQLGPWGAPPAGVAVGTGPVLAPLQPYSTAFLAVAAAVDSAGGSPPASPRRSSQPQLPQQQSGAAAAAPWPAGYVINNVLASPMHWPLTATPDAVHAWVSACARVPAADVHAAVREAVSKHTLLQQQHAAAQRGHSSVSVGKVYQGMSQTDTSVLAFPDPEWQHDQDGCWATSRGHLPGGKACSSMQLSAWELRPPSRTASVLSDLGPSPTTQSPCKPAAAAMHSEPCAAHAPSRPSDTPTCLSPRQDGGVQAAARHLRGSCHAASENLPGHSCHTTPRNTCSPAGCLPEHSNLHHVTMPRYGSQPSLSSSSSSPALPGGGHTHAHSQLSGGDHRSPLNETTNRMADWQGQHNRGGNMPRAGSSLDVQRAHVPAPMDRSARRSFCDAPQHRPWGWPPQAPLHTVKPATRGLSCEADSEAGAAPGVLDGAPEVHSHVGGVAGNGAMMSRPPSRRASGTWHTGAAVHSVGVAMGYSRSGSTQSLGEAHTVAHWHGSSGALSTLASGGQRQQGYTAAVAAGPFWLPSAPVCTDGIVSLCPGATEVLAAMGLAGRLVGITDGCDWPSHLRGNTPIVCRNRLALLGPGPSKVGDRGESPDSSSAQLVVDEDLLVEERPGLVVLPDLRKLREADQKVLTKALQHTVLGPQQHSLGLLESGVATADGALVLVHSTRTLTDVVDGVLKLGDAAGAPQAAGTLADRMRARLRRVAAHAARSAASAPSVAAPKVLVLSGLTGTVMGRAGGWVPEMLSLAGAEQPALPYSVPCSASAAMRDPANHTVHAAPYSACGGRALCQALEPGEPGSAVSWEELVAMAPDVLIIAHDTSAATAVAATGPAPGCGAQGLTSTLAALVGLASNPGWWSLPSVRAGAVYLVDAPLLNRPGPRLVEGVEVLAHVVECHRQQARNPASSSAAPRRVPSAQDTAAITAMALASTFYWTPVDQTSAAGGSGDGTAGLPRLAAGAVLKLALSGGQRCRPSLLPYYFISWPYQGPRVA